MKQQIIENIIFLNNKINLQKGNTSFREALEKCIMVEKFQRLF